MVRKCLKKGNFDYDFDYESKYTSKYVLLDKIKLVDGQSDIVESIGNIFKDMGDNLRPVETRIIEN